MCLHGTYFVYFHLDGVNLERRGGSGRGEVRVPSGTQKTQKSRVLSCRPFNFDEPETYRSETLTRTKKRPKSESA